MQLLTTQRFTSFAAQVPFPARIKSYFQVDHTLRHTTTKKKKQEKHTETLKKWWIALLKKAWDGLETSIMFEGDFGSSHPLSHRPRWGGGSQRRVQTWRNAWFRCLGGRRADVEGHTLMLVMSSKKKLKWPQLPGLNPYQFAWESWDCKFQLFFFWMMLSDGWWKPCGNPGGYSLSHFDPSWIFNLL